MFVPIETFGLNIVDFDGKTAVDNCDEIYYNMHRWGIPSIASAYKSQILVIQKMALRFLCNKLVYIAECSKQLILPICRCTH